MTVNNAMLLTKNMICARSILVFSGNRITSHKARCPTGFRYPSERRRSSMAHARKIPPTTNKNAKPRYMFGFRHCARKAFTEKLDFSASIPEWKTYHAHQADEA